MVNQHSKGNDAQKSRGNNLVLDPLGLLLDPIGLFRKRGYSLILLAVGFLFLGFLLASVGIWLLCLAVVGIVDRKTGGFARLLLAIMCIGLSCVFSWYGFVFWQ